MIRRRRMRLYRGEFWDILKTLMTMGVSKGSHIGEFQKQFARYIGVNYAFATCTGRDGLSLILEALGLEEGDEVILPAYTLKDLIFLIQHKGFIPVLVDIDKDTYNIDPTLIERAISRKTKVIVATHMFGSPCDIEKITNMAKRYDISVIEDCAHAAGAEYKGRKVGSFGKAAFFSFEAFKPINTFGGGMVTTDDADIAAYIGNKINKLPYDGKNVIFKIFYTYFEHFILFSPIYFFISFLMKSEYFSRIISKVYLFIHRVSRPHRFRYSNLQALMGLKQLKNLDKRNLLRRKKTADLANLLDSDIATPKTLPGAISTYYFFVIKTQFHSKEIRKYLIGKGVDSSIGSEITDDCSQILCQDDCPLTKKVYRHALQIPLYEELNSRDIKNIAGAINNSKRI